jgi:pimeloyl-ACP methyl ester carboxylesterase
VSFPGGAADVTLAGTLTVPTTPGPHPAVVLMSGSGPQDRDERLAGIDFGIFALLADALAQHGIAVLRYDDRGTAASTGSYAGALIPDFTADGAAALAYLRSRPEVDPARAGILGHSEGGIYAAAIAADDPGVAFVVGLAPAVGTGLEVIVDQNEAILRADGASEEALRLTRESTPAIYRAALDGDLARATELARAWFGGLYDLSSAEEQAQMGDRSSWVDAQAEALIATVATDEFRSFLRTDPAADWRQVTSPTLGVFGEKDVQVVAHAEAPRLEAALAAAGNTRSRVVVLAGANHMFQAAGTGAVSEYGSLPAAFTPELLPLVTGWIAGVTGLDAEGSPGPS